MCCENWKPRAHDRNYERADYASRLRCQHACQTLGRCKRYDPANLLATAMEYVLRSQHLTEGINQCFR